jgi:hypothetical protein
MHTPRLPVVALAALLLLGCNSAAVSGKRWVRQAGELDAEDSCEQRDDDDAAAAEGDSDGKESRCEQRQLVGTEPAPME